MKKKLLLGLLLLLPTTALAFFGFDFGSGDLLLGKILAEAIRHSTKLEEMVKNLDLLNGLQLDMRRGIDDPLPLGLGGFGVREIPFLGQISALSRLKDFVQNIWGALPRTTSAAPLAVKDEQAIYSLGQAAEISDESSQYFDAGHTILEDLRGSHEGKATIRGAQASALQVQQLSQIEANQGLQISLQAEELLSRNEYQKAIQEFHDRYLEMLGAGFASLKPMGPK